MRRKASEQVPWKDVQIIRKQRKNSMERSSLRDRMVRPFG